MTIILHLSDIHFKDGVNPVSGRARAIGEAVASFLRNAELCIVACSGDVAYSGREDEYLAALSFFSELDEALKAANPAIRLEYAFVPGNHDCDFRDTRGVRDVLLEALKLDSSKCENRDIRTLCTEVQRAFAAFQSALAGANLTTYDPLHWVYQFSSAAGEICLRCFNTAWMSQLSEKAGELLFPTAVISESRPAALTISMFHHPYNWLHPENYRAFRKIVESTSDIVLTGHEHEAGSYKKASSSGETNEYIEGAVLQDSENPDNSGFNLLVLNPQDRQQKVLHFQYVVDHYRPHASPHDWQPFQVNALRQLDAFAVDELFFECLEDIGLTLSVAGSRKIRLSDLFVFPDLREINYSKKSRIVIQSANVVERILADGTVLVTGPERSGKTALAKGLFLTLHQKGYVPLLVRCSSASASAAEDTGRFVEKLYVEQYAGKDYERYRQLAAGKKIIILDDLHLWNLPRSKKLGILNNFRDVADTIVVLSNELAHQIEDIVYSTESLTAKLDFHPYRIQEFGFLLRELLLDRWFLLVANSSTVTDEEVAQRVASAKRVIKTIVGKNFVPAFPVFILSILQAQEAATPVEVHASTYGYFYDIFVRGSLAKGSREFDQDTKLAYLARLARWMFDRQETWISEANLRLLHQEFEQHIKVQLNFAKLLEDFLQTGMLKTDSERARFGFRYAYIYYYFAATQLRDSLTEQSTRALIADISGRLWIEEYANILLFLAHLSRDPFIIDTMVSRAKGIYKEQEPAALLSDVDFVNELFPDDDGVEYLDAEAGTLRRKLLGSLDELEAEVPEEDHVAPEQAPQEELETADEIDPVLRLNTALKTIQILGQILKNFTALSGDVKFQVADECYRLGLRALGAVYEMMRQNREGVIDAVLQILRREHPKAAEDALHGHAKRAIFELAEIIAYGLIKRISHAVGSEKLSITYEELVAANPSPAVQLIDTSIKLDNAAAIPEPQVLAFKKAYFKNPLAVALLKQMVVHHFYLFDVNFVVKQRLCDKLGIPYKKYQVTDAKQKLIK